MEQLFKIIHKFPRLFALVGIKHVQPDIEDERDDVMGTAERFNWEKLKNQGDDWVDDFLGTHLEVQKWMDCTGHAVKSIIQILLKVKYNEDVKVSAAYINGMAGTNKWKGNSKRKVLDSVRKYGWLTDEEWPEENRWLKIPQSLINVAKARCGNEDAEYDFGYDLAFSTAKGLQECSLYSPPDVAGAAWAKRNGLYYSFGRPNHAFIILRYIINSVKRIGDSYKPHVKDVEDAYKFYYVRRIYLGKKNENKYTRLLNKGTKYIVRPNANGEFYKVTKNGLEYIPSDKIKDTIKDDTDLNANLTELTKQKKVMWVPEDWYNNLIK